MIAHVLRATSLAANFSLVGLHNILEGKSYDANPSTASTCLDDNDEC